jgi:hypothetical protein
MLAAGSPAVVPTPSQQAKSEGSGSTVAAPQKRKFHNGWTREVETLMARWADVAICFRWMHERTHRIYQSRDMAFMFPVIILSTVTGAANFAMDSILTDPEHKKIAQLALGGLSIATGIISTIANRLGYASNSEAHKGAAVHWGKFQRLLTIELSLHPNERTECMMFLKTCRTELDRLIEQSPTIPDMVINACREEFKQYPNVRKPEIVGDIDTTHVFQDTNSRLKELARDAAMMIQAKKGTLKQIVLDDLEPRIQRVIEFSTLPALKEELKKDLQRAAEKAARAALAGPPRRAQPPADVPAAADEQRIAERKAEVDQIANTGVVSSIRKRWAEALINGAPVALPGLVQQADAVVLHVEDESSSEAEEASHDAQGEEAGPEKV